MDDPRPRFDYDTDPETRQFEQFLERPALLQKAARAQRRARLWLRARWWLGGFLVAGLLVGGWRLARPFFEGKKGGATEAEKGAGIKRDSAAAPVLEKKLEEAAPTSAPPSPPPPAGGSKRPVAIFLEESEARFSAEFRPVASALKKGRLTEAGRQLALLEKPTDPDDEVRALDDEEEARLDTLAYLRGLLFLKKREFAAAAEQFARLDERGKQWRGEAQFYLFQALFLGGKRAEAEVFYEKMRGGGEGAAFFERAKNWRRGAAKY